MMEEDQAEDRDLKIDVFIGDGAKSYRVTHIPSGVFAESDSLAGAVDAVNEGLEDGA